MAQQKLSNEDLDAIRELGKRWGKIVVSRACPDGVPTTLDITAMEDIAEAASKALNAGAVEEFLHQQVESLKRAPCPTCGKDCPLVHEKRELVTRGSICTYAEPKGHCPACRRAFFPSASSVAS